jgi:hypothetical protein
VRVADQRVPRGRPCAARDVTPGAPLCGATPAFPWRRTCPAGHDREVRLCQVHATIMLAAPGCCAECLDNGGLQPAVLEPLLERMEPV